jgi:hypothetical protein
VEGGSGDVVRRTTNGAAISGFVRARESIAKAMALRDKVSERERLYIEAQAARRDPEMVPNIPHALHMPGHIYAQSDKIDEAAAAFSAAAVNELSWLERDVLYSNGHHAHSVHFLVHSLNLDGRLPGVDGAGTPPDELQGNAARARRHQPARGLPPGILRSGQTLVRFERGDLILDGTTIPIYDRPEQNAWRNWALGLAHVWRGELEPARASLAQLDNDVAQAKASRDALAVAVLELEGEVAVRAGETKQGWALLRKAAAKEKALIYTEPPDYPRPVVEAMGSLALRVGDSVTAERAYTEALAVESGGGRAYFGLAAALAGLERPEEAQARLEQAERAWNKADSDLPRMQKLRSGKLASVREPN